MRENVVWNDMEMYQLAKSMLERQEECDRLI